MPSKLNVLLVDDSKTLIAQLSRIIEEIDEVSLVGVAANGSEAIRKVAELRPDVVLMDIVMPGMDGMAALRILNATHPEVTVAMASSVGGTAAQAEEAFRLGAAQVLAKPFDPTVIESFFEQVRRSRR